MDVVEITEDEKEAILLDKRSKNLSNINIVLDNCGSSGAFYSLIAELDKSNAKQPIKQRNYKSESVTSEESLNLPLETNIAINIFPCERNQKSKGIKGFGGLMIYNMITKEDNLDHLRTFKCNETKEYFDSKN